MFFNLIVRVRGQEMPIMCLGERNLLYHLGEVERAGVPVIRVETVSGKLSASTVRRIDRLVRR